MCCPAGEHVNAERGGEKKLPTCSFPTIPATPPPHPAPFTRIYRWRKGGREGRGTEDANCTQMQKVLKRKERCGERKMTMMKILNEDVQVYLSLNSEPILAQQFKGFRKPTEKEPKESERRAKT